MADNYDLDYTYSNIDKIFRLSMGQTGDYSGAKYDGDFSMTLEDAQKVKHMFIADSLHIKKGSNVLDMACGWGAFLNYVTKDRAAKSIGLTLSKKQAVACQRSGLNVIEKDCRYFKADDLGTFDAITCIGGFEHFCSLRDYRKGKQEWIYRNFFKTVYNLLPVGGRFYMQSMTFSKNMISFDEFDINAPKDTPAYICALMEKQFPGSWLPYGPEMIVRNATPMFKLVSQSSGRLDYIETINQWRKKYRKFSIRKYFLYLTLLPKYVINKEFRHMLSVFKISPTRVCLEKEIMNHYRFVFEKV